MEINTIFIERGEGRRENTQVHIINSWKTLEFSAMGKSVLRVWTCAHRPHIWTWLAFPKRPGGKNIKQPSIVLLETLPAPTRRDSELDLISSLEIKIIFYMQKHSSCWICFFGSVFNGSLFYLERSSQPQRTSKIKHSELTKVMICVRVSIKKYFQIFTFFLLGPCICWQ